MSVYLTVFRNFNEMLVYLTGFRNCNEMSVYLRVVEVVIKGQCT